tara:strand:- start:2916 stop:3947 length:1032 start_codon:yes stop_codon:yes gene_type:complete
VLDFQIQHMRSSSRMLLTPLTNRRDDRPKLSALLSPQDIKPPEPKVNPIAERVYSPEVELSADLRLMIAMVAYLSGKAVTTFQQSFGSSSDDYAGKNTVERAAFDLSSLDASAAVSSTTEPSTNASMVLSANTYQISVREAERLDFSLSTEVTTRDGRVHQVHVAESHQRQHRQTLSVSASEAAALIDPLVINLYGPLSFQSDTTEFDLDSDGHAEEFHQLSSGSFFLALDINGDDTINNGSELFGTQSGNGFADLRHYDDDGNGLIDERDAVFSALRLYRTDDDHLMSLDEAQVLAIGLSAADTPFTFKDRQGNTQAQLRQSSFYVSATGQHGSVQHVDLAV